MWDNEVQNHLVQTSLLIPALVSNKLTIRPNSARASPKMRTITRATNRLGYWATALLPAYPATPIAMPAAREAIPVQRPAPK